MANPQCKIEQRTKAILPCSIALDLAANVSTHGEFLTPLNSLGFLLPSQIIKITKRVRSREPALPEHSIYAARPSPLAAGVGA